MIRSVIVRREAEQDIQSAHGFHEQAQLGLGYQFITRVRQALERIEKNPELYGIIWQDVRAARLKQFRYVVYYVLFADRVEILAVTHASRDASSWQPRA